MIKNITCALLILSCLLACKRESTSPETAAIEGNSISPTQAQREALSVKLDTLKKKTLSETIHANGVLDVPPQNLVTISAPMGGFVKHTDLLQGVYVKKGRPLIELEDIRYIELQQEFLDQSSQLELARDEFNRQKTLSQENVNAQKTLQQATAHLKSLEAKVEALKAKLIMVHISPDQVHEHIHKSVTLYSPISGYVTEVNVNIGKYLNPTDVLFKIVDTEHLHVELFIFERDISKLKEEQKLHFSLVNEGTDRTATIHLIGREIGADRTVRVHCHLDKEDPALLPGMYVKASIETNSREAYVAPDNAVVNFEENTYLFTTSDGITFHMEAVTTGLKENGFTEILPSEKFPKGTRIVTSGAYQLLSMLKNSEEE